MVKNEELEASKQYKSLDDITINRFPTSAQAENNQPRLDIERRDQGMSR